MRNSMLITNFCSKLAKNGIFLENVYLVTMLFAESHIAELRQSYILAVSLSIIYHSDNATFRNVRLSSIVVIGDLHFDIPHYRQNSQTVSMDFAEKYIDDMQMIEIRRLAVSTMRLSAFYHFEHSTIDEVHIYHKYFPCFTCTKTSIHTGAS